MAKRRAKVVDVRPLRFFSKIRGVTEQNADGSSRQKWIKGCRVGQRLTLIREPENEYDPDTIAVYAGRRQLGYLSAEVAEELAPRMDAGQSIAATVKDLTGGGWLTKRTRGVNIELFTVDQAAASSVGGCAWKLLSWLTIAVVVLIIVFVLIGLAIGRRR